MIERTAVELLGPLSRGDTTSEALTGEFLQATKFVSRVDWGSVDPKTGIATPDPAHEPTVQGTFTCPSTAGGTNWPSPRRPAGNSSGWKGCAYLNSSSWTRARCGV